MMQLRLGLDGSTRLLDAATLRGSARMRSAPPPRSPTAPTPFLERPTTTASATGSRRRTDRHQAPPTGQSLVEHRQVRLGAWIAADSSYAAVIMTRQADLPTSFVPSENLKASLERSFAPRWLATPRSYGGAVTVVPRLLYLVAFSAMFPFSASVVRVHSQMPRMRLYAITTTSLPGRAAPSASAARRLAAGPVSADGPRRRAPDTAAHHTRTHQGEPPCQCLWPARPR